MCNHTNTKTYHVGTIAFVGGDIKEDLIEVVVCLDCQKVIESEIEDRGTEEEIPF
jgi:hypothetical protein